MIQWMLATWSLVSQPLLNSACTSGSSQMLYCWSLAWRMLNITFLACEMTAIAQQFEHFLIFPFFEIGMKTNLFQSHGHCWVFQICWYIEWLDFPFCPRAQHSQCEYLLVAKSQKTAWVTFSTPLQEQEIRSDYPEASKVIILLQTSVKMSSSRRGECWCALERSTLVSSQPLVRRDTEASGPRQEALI